MTETKFVKRTAEESRRSTELIGAAISDNLESNDRLTNRVSALQPDDLLCPARF